MKAGASLAAWLASPEQQRASLDRSNGFAAAAAARPVMRDLKDALVAMPDRTDLAVLAIVRDFFKREDELIALLDDVVVTCAQDPFFRPPFSRVVSDLNAGILIFEDPALIITMNAVSAQAIAEHKLTAGGGRSINFTGYLNLFKFIRAGDALLSWWEAPATTGAFESATSGKCRQVGERRLADGDDVLMDGRHESFVVEHVSSDLLHLQATIRLGSAPLNLEYDARHHGFIGAASTDEAASRVQMMVSLLRMMDRTDAIPLIAEALKNEHFFTRWHVMREFLALDAEAAFPYLQAMAGTDPHPEVRAAAAQTLGAFFEQAEAEPCHA